MTRAFILDFLKEHKDELHQKFGLTKIGLFGSYARGDENIESDIDLAIEINSKNSFRSFFGLKTYLEDNFHKKVDLGIESSLKPIVKEYVSKEIIYV